MIINDYDRLFANTDRSTVGRLAGVRRRVHCRRAAPERVNDRNWTGNWTKRRGVAESRESRVGAES